MDNRNYLIQDLQRAFSNDNSPRNEVEAAVQKKGRSDKRRSV